MLNRIINSTAIVNLGKNQGVPVVLPNTEAFGLVVEDTVAIDLKELEEKFKTEGWDFKAFVTTFKTVASIKDAKDETVEKHLERALTQAHKLQQPEASIDVPQGEVATLNALSVALATLAQVSFQVQAAATDGKVAWTDTIAAINTALVTEVPTPDVISEVPAEEPTVEIPVDAAPEVTSEVPTEQEVVPQAEVDQPVTAETETEEVTVETLPAEITSVADGAAVALVLQKIVTMNKAAIQSNKVINDLLVNQMAGFTKLMELQTLNSTQLETANELFAGIQDGLAQVGAAPQLEATV